MLNIAAGLALGILALVWVVYPCVIAVLALFRRPEVSDSTAHVMPSVSIVLASRDGPCLVEARIRDLIRSEYPGDMEIVVSRDGVAVPEPRLATIHPSVRLTAADAPGGKAMALNAAVRLCRGEILVFADTHQRFDADAVTQLVRALRSERIGAVSGRLELPSPDKRTVAELYWRFERWLRKHEATLHSPIGVTGAIWAMRRALWEPLPAGLILDDLFTPMRLVMQGQRVAFCPVARALETRIVEPMREYARKVRTLTGVLQVCAWLPSLLVPWRNPVWLQFLAHKLLRLLTPYALCVIALSALVDLLELIRRQPSMVAILAVLLLLPFARGPRGTARVIRELILVQSAVVVAMMGGVLGRWNVWSR